MRFARCALLLTLLGTSRTGSCADLADPFPTTPEAPLAELDNDAPFDINKTPLSNLDFLLLTKAGYTFDAAGGISKPKTGRPIGTSEMFYVLEDLRSRQRLTALLAIRLIYSRSPSPDKLAAADREELRGLARQNWPLLAHGTRGELSPHFSTRELQEMNEALPKDSSATLPPEVRSISAATVSEDVRLPVASPLKTFAGTLMPLGVEAQEGKGLSGLPPPDAKAPAPAAPVGPTPLSVTRSSVPVLPAVEPPVAPAVEPPPPNLPTEQELGGLAPAEAPVEPPAPPAPVPAPVPVAAPPAPIAPAADGVQPPAPVPAPAPAVSTLLTTAPVTVVPGAPPAASAVEPPAPASEGKIEFLAEPADLAPPPRDVAPAGTPAAPMSQAPEPPYASYDPAGLPGFLETAPYADDVKTLLTLIGRHARDPERRAALGVLTEKMPHIVIDSRKAGSRAAASLAKVDGAEADRTQIAINDGPVLFKPKRLLGDAGIFLLPDDPRFYERHKLAPPALQALSREEAWDKDIRDEDLGDLRIYADKSRRLKRSPEAMAGALFNALLRCDAQARGWGDDVYTGLRAAAAEFRFYTAYETDTGREPVLDRERLILYREWQEHPDDYTDFMMQTVSSPGPSQEAAVLSVAGLAPASGTPAKETSLSLPRSDSAAAAAWLQTDERARKTP